MKIAGNGESDNGKICCGQDDAYVEVLKDKEWKRELNKEIVDEIIIIVLNVSFHVHVDLYVGTYSVKRVCNSDKKFVLTLDPPCY